MFSLISAETEVPFSAAMRLSVSPDLTVYEPLDDVEAEEDSLEEEDEFEEPELFENFRFWPGKMRLDDRPFACMRSDTDTPSFCAAMSERVSPRSTV